jgi:tRNA-dihydrouridine synthase B
MHTFINSSWQIGNLSLPHRLIQGPLAGYSCAPFRELFYQFTPPAFCVAEMSSAIDIINKHSNQSRYIYRSPVERILAYQISGNDQYTMAEAALVLQNTGANLIDINCGCPKTKIRKKGSGSALLEEPQKLVDIIKTVRKAISIPLTVKIRIQGNENDTLLAKKIADAGADALIVHGRRWVDDYGIQCNLEQITQIKQSINIPVIANGDINDPLTLKKAIEISGCDAYMISRAGSGRPWIYKELLEQRTLNITFPEKISLFMSHLKGLADLEDEFKAVLQSKSLVRYYFKKQLDELQLNHFYKLNSLDAINDFLQLMKV